MVYPMLFPGIILLNYGALGVGCGGAEEAAVV